MISIRQALAMELRLNSGRFGASAALCVLCLVVALLLVDSLMAVLPLWAALAWYRYGRADTAERDELRASLGLSRADRVRGRVALIAVETALLILTSSLWLLLAPALSLETTIGAGPTVTFSGPPGLPAVVLVLAGALQSAFVLLITAIVVGEECTIRRPGTGMAVVSVLVYLVAGLLSTLLWIPVGMLEVSAATAVPWLFGSAAVLAGCAVLALVLRRRVRAWIGRLDAGTADCARMGA